MSGVLVRLPYVLLRVSSLRARRRVRREARRFVEHLAMSAAVHSPEQLVDAAGEICGALVEFRKEDLEPGFHSVARREGDRIVVVVSVWSGSVWFSVAHEVGHLLLEHSQMVGTEMKYVDRGGAFEVVPPDYLPIWEHMVPRSAERVKQKAFEEMEADVFADEVLRLLPTVGFDARRRAWAAGL